MKCNSHTYNNAQNIYGMPIHIQVKVYRPIVCYAFIKLQLGSTDEEGESRTLKVKQLSIKEHKEKKRRTLLRCLLRVEAFTE